MISVINIVINGRSREVDKDVLSFEELSKYAFPDAPPDQNTIYTVAFENAADRKEGFLVAGETVKVQKGTLFHVTATNKS